MKIKEVFAKISEFFKKIFFPNNIKLIAEESKMTEKENEKKDFFETYNNVKNGKIKPQDLMITDLVKVLSMEKEEINMYDKKIKQKKEELATLKTENKMLEDENTRD